MAFHIMFLQWSERSGFHKKQDLILLLNKFKPLTISLTETWLQPILNFYIPHVKVLPYLSTIKSPYSPYPCIYSQMRSAQKQGIYGVSVLSDFLYTKVLSQSLQEKRLCHILVYKYSCRKFQLLINLSPQEYTQIPG